MIGALRFRTSHVALLAALLACVAPASRSQSIVYGAIAGRVTDEAGRPVADAEITLRDRISGTSREFVTGRDGIFRATFLSPSAYEVRVEALGYHPVLHQAVAVRSGGAASLLVRLRTATPPVVTVDTIRAGAVRPTPFTWLAERGYAELVGGSRLLADAGALSTAADDRGVEGLAWRRADISVDGAMLGAAGSGGLAGRTTTAAAVPLAAAAQATVGGLDWDTEIGGVGVGISALTRRGGDGSARRWGVFGGSSDHGASLRIEGPLQRDTAHVALGLDVQRSEVPRPAAIVAGDVEGLALLQSARDDHGTDLGALAAAVPVTAERASAYARLDWDLADRYAISVRGAGSYVRSEEATSRALGLGAPVEATALQAAVNLRTRLTERISTEVRLSGDVFDGSAVASRVPSTLFAGRGVAVGGSAGEPFRDLRLTPRLNALLHWDLGRHRLKLGAIVASNRFETEGGGAPSSEFRFGDAVDLAALSGAFRAVTGPVRSGSFRMGESAMLIQDAWQVAEGFDLLLGLRFDTHRLPVRQLATEGAWLLASGLDNGTANASRKALAPRLGLRWELGSARQWTVEGGAGVYHDLPDHFQFGEALALDRALPVRGGVGTLSSWPGAPDAVTAQPLGGTLAMLGPGFEGARTRRLALSLSRGARGWTSWIGGVYRHTDHLARRSDLNLPVAATGSDQYGRALHGELVQLGSLLAAAPGSNRRFAGFDAVHAIEVTGFSEYRAAVVGVERAFDVGLSFGLQYTFSQTVDNLVDGGRAASGPLPTATNSPWGEGVSDLDAPHRLLAALDWSSRRAGAIRLGIIYHLASGAPFTPTFRDGVDANADGVFTGDPAFVDAALPGMDALLSEWSCLRRDAGAFARRNGCRGDLQHRLDARFTVRLRELAGGPLELVVDALDLASAARSLVDRALVLVDRTGTLTTDPVTGVTTVPLAVNPGFGGPLAERSAGALFRFGLRIGR